ncbi:glutamate receptor 1-like [Aphis craccivora]|uniref:Glutamate receptor 1-like n=1 Tax=Aphis craccivora TaxID=307492 RepID=A0A6G0YW63_APHCR|nr:glutamate receptor 1-like [Aphis craccivora]
MVQIVCIQFSRGVYSMLGSVNPDSFDTLHSYSNTFQMPFVTPWFPEQLFDWLIGGWIGHLEDAED